MAILTANTHNLTSDNGTYRVTSPLSGSPVFFVYSTTKLTSYYFTLFVCKHQVTSPHLIYRLNDECDKHLLSTILKVNDLIRVV